jgi:hypothetical protein
MRLAMWLISAPAGQRRPSRRPPALNSAPYGTDMACGPELVRTTKKPQVNDLRLNNGADDGNRTRALSLGITGALSASVLVSAICGPKVPTGAVPLVAVADRSVPLRVVRKWCGQRDWPAGLRT